MVDAVAAGEPETPARVSVVVAAFEPETSVEGIRCLRSPGIIRIRVESRATAEHGPAAGPAICPSGKLVPPAAGPWHPKPGAQCSTIDHMTGRLPACSVIRDTPPRNASSRRRVDQIHDPSPAAGAFGDGQILALVLTGQLTFPSSSGHLRSGLEHGQQRLQNAAEATRRAPTEERPKYCQEQQPNTSHLTTSFVSAGYTART
jgi:hypothetical protein